MEILLKLIDQRFDAVIKDWDLLRLPAVLRRLRLAYGQSKRSVSQDTGIQYNRLYHLENGSFSSFITPKEISILSTYYSTDLGELTKKVDEYTSFCRGEA